MNIADEILAGDVAFDPFDKSPERDLTPVLRRLFLTRGNPTSPLRSRQKR